jgi:hypothetical protein
MPLSDGAGKACKSNCNAGVKRQPLWLDNYCELAGLLELRNKTPNSESQESECYALKQAHCKAYLQPKQRVGERHLNVCAEGTHGMYFVGRE